MARKAKTKNMIAVFSPLRRAILALLYLAVSIVLCWLLFRGLYTERLYSGIFFMLISGDKGFMENIVLVLLLLTLPAFLLFFCGSVSLFFICLAIDGQKCFLKSEGCSIAFSAPDMGGGYPLRYKEGSADISGGRVMHVICNESWSRARLVPVREIMIEFADGRNLVIDSVFFKERLSDVKEALEFISFHGEAPEPHRIPEYREGESVLDAEGRFIPPGDGKKRFILKVALNWPYNIVGQS